MISRIARHVNDIAFFRLGISRYAKEVAVVNLEPAYLADEFPISLWKLDGQGSLRESDRKGGDASADAIVVGVAIGFEKFAN